MTDNEWRKRHKLIDSQVGKSCLSRLNSHRDPSQLQRSTSKPSAFNFTETTQLT
jgi:hypothetical protein